MTPSQPFYPPEYTDRSRAVLARVRHAVPEAVLIGGWATWLRTGGAMSHDVDLIVTRAQLAQLSSIVDDVSESRHLGGRKWRGTIDGIHLDLYVPYESRLGQHLQLRIERLIQRTDHIREWVVLDLPGHLATKLAALLDRPDSMPGEKDRQEIVSLLAHDLDPTEAVAAINAASALTPAEVRPLLAQAFTYLRDMTLKEEQRRRLSRLAAEWDAASRQLPVDPERNRSSPDREHGLDR
jgi:hypothetical protein